MAKKKKEEVIDFTKPEKVTDAELGKVQNTINELNKSQLEIGTLELRKHDLLHGIAGLRDELTVLQKDLEKEYNTFDINIQDGTINYPENGEVNKKN